MDIDCVVVGGGPAGLAASAALTGRDVEHVVFERGRPGQTWRSQRWHSFRLNTPGWANPMLGDQDRDEFLTAGEVVQRLDNLAADARCGPVWRWTSWIDTPTASSWTPEPAVSGRGPW